MNPVFQSRNSRSINTQKYCGNIYDEGEDGKIGPSFVTHGKMYYEELCLVTGLLWVLGPMKAMDLSPFASRLP